jgi:nucleoid DNA-binding protein/cell division septation protein DedD
MGIDVSLYLSHLLYRNNVAILPGFGAFVATTTPAVVDHARGIISPPSKVLTFNENLKINDGFLINLIRHKHGITAHEARTIVENFVLSMNDILKNKDTIRLDSIGKLYHNIHRQIIFEPDTKANFNATTFGLPAIQYHPLSRNISFIKPTEKPLNIPNTEIANNEISNNTVSTAEIPPISPEKRTSWYYEKRYLVAAALIGFTATTALWYHNQSKNITIPEARIIPTEVRVNVKPGQEIAENAVNQQDTSISLEGNTVAEPSKEITTPTQEKSKEEPLSELSEGYETTLLVGSYSRKSNIRRVEKRLRRKGFEVYNAPFKGLHRIGVIVHCRTAKEKKQHIATLQKMFGNTVWELEK